jgi:uncharacterized protein YciI
MDKLIVSWASVRRGWSSLDRPKPPTVQRSQMTLLDKITGLAVLSLIGGNLAGADMPAVPATAYPPYVLTNTVCRVLPRTAQDRIYKLIIGLPDSYTKNPEKKYPIILVTDGYWAFPTVNACAGGLAYGKHIPDSIVVGLSYDGENLDYSKLRGMDLGAGTWKGRFDEEDHAERFLRVIETQIIPLMEREYRADPNHRYIVGSSAGADFVLFAMLSKPQLFQGYVADSPLALVHWNMERAFVAAGRKVEGRFSLSASGNEWAGYRKWIPLFYERLKQDGVVKGGLVYRETPGVRHGAGTSEAYMRGLMYVMEPLAPDHGVATDMFVEAPGKRSILVSFWIPKTTASDEAVAGVRRDHEAYLAKLLADKRAIFEHLDSADVTGSAGAILIEATSKAEVTALIGEDPAVKAKMVEFEVIGE